MRKITFGVANSVDNRIAREGGAVDWLLWSDEVMALMDEFWENVDTALVGRKTYDETSTMEAPTMPGVKTYVFSRTLKELADPKVELVTEDAVEFVRKLKDMEGKDICLLGGGEFAHCLFEAKLIDEIALNKIHDEGHVRGCPTQ